MGRGRLVQRKSSKGSFLRPVQCIEAKATPKPKAKETSDRTRDTSNLASSSVLVLRAGMALGVLKGKEGIVGGLGMSL